MTPLCGQIRAEPALGLLAGEPGHDLGAFGDQPGLVLLPEDVLALGIGAAVPDIFVAAPVEPLDDIGAVFEHRRVDVVRAGQGELVEKVEVVPDADPVAVIAPGVIALVLRDIGPGRIAAEPAPEREMLDIVAEEHGEPLALGPVIDRPPGDRDVVVAVMGGEFHRHYSCMSLRACSEAISSSRCGRHEMASLRSQ